MSFGEKKTRIRVKPIDDGGAEIFVLVSHPMQTGLCTNPRTRERIPAHFIQKVTFHVNGEKVAVADTGAGLSANPFLSIRVSHIKKGDRVEVVWSDNFGQKGEEEVTVGEAS